MLSIVGNDQLAPVAAEVNEWLGAVRAAPATPEPGSLTGPCSEQLLKCGPSVHWRDLGAPVARPRSSPVPAKGASDVAADERPGREQMIIERVQGEEGFLDGLDLSLSKGWNVLIGP
jgi:hypothetical protein